MHLPTSSHGQVAALTAWTQDRIRCCGPYRSLRAGHTTTFRACPRARPLARYLTVAAPGEETAWNSYLRFHGATVKVLVPQLRGQGRPNRDMHRISRPQMNRVDAVATSTPTTRGSDAQTFLLTTRRSLTHTLTYRWCCLPRTPASRRQTLNESVSAGSDAIGIAVMALPVWRRFPSCIDKEARLRPPEP